MPLCSWEPFDDGPAQDGGIGDGEDRMTWDTLGGRVGRTCA